MTREHVDIADPYDEIRVVFTVDTEPDNQWADHRGGGLSNIEGLGSFHDFLSALGVVPTYLMTYTVAEDVGAVHSMQKLLHRDDCEIGAHLHPWDNPPFLTDLRDQRFPAFAHELPLEHVADKLEQLTSRIKANFDAPRCYRAGRFGYCADHIAVLESLGYRVDSSVTPLLDRRRKTGIPLAQGGRGGRDYRSAPLDPYHPSTDDELKLGSASLLEVPLTAGVIGLLPNWMTQMQRHMPESIRRMPRKLGLSEVVTASPVQFSTDAIMKMITKAVAAGRRVVNFTMHSSEAVAGHSPSIRTEQDLRNLFCKIEQLIHGLGSIATCRFVKLGALADTQWPRQS